MKNFWTVVIVIIVILVIYKILNLPDRELTAEEKRANISICRQYYGSGQDYEDCVNGNNMGRD
jgi:hypothetical protein